MAQFQPEKHELPQNLPMLFVRVEEAKNMRRFYRLDIQPDLFGGWNFVREWGRIGNSGRGQSINLFCETFEAACNLFRQHHRIRERRGYHHEAAGS